MKKHAYALLAVILLAGLNLNAQVNASSALAGTVSDSSGAVVPGADVKVSNKDTGLSRDAKSNAVGQFRFDLLPAGTYEVRVTSPGFATAVYANVGLAVSQTTTVDVTLKPSSRAEVVTVESSGVPLIDTTKTDVGLSITPSDVANRPLNGRDFANLAFLAPGAKPVNSYDPTKNRLAVFGINGSAGRNVNVTVNGIDNKDGTVGGPVMQLPLGAVQEFNISTQRFSAANGRSEGAAVNVITKSGENNIHGGLFLFARDTSLTATDYFAAQANQPTPPISRQQYGGSIGGPFQKDKTFAFFALERQREETSLGVTDAAFNELTIAKTAGLAAEPVRIIATPYQDQRYTGRLDHRFNSANNFFVTWNNQGNTGQNDQTSQTNDLTAGNFTVNDLILANATLNSVLSPRTVNSFTFGYQYWHNLIDSNKKVPNVSFPNSIYFGTNGNVPQESVQAKWQFRDDISRTIGKHSLKFGADYVNVPKLGGFFFTPPTLNVSFIDLPSKIITDKSTYPNSFATAGAISNMSGSSGDSYFFDKDARMFGVYVQDDFKASQRLTLNVGLRWDADYNLQGGNLQGKSRTYLNLKAVNSPFASRLPANDFNNFSPRIGFAYDITGKGKHILRGGYGIYFGQTFLNLPLFMMQQANATLFTQTLQYSSTGPGDTGASIVSSTGKRLSEFRYGVDPLPAIPPGSANLPAGAVGRLVDPDFQNPYNHQWNAGYAWQINNASVVEVEYVKILGLREAKRQNINYIRPELGNTRPYDAAFAAAGLPLLAQIVVESSIGRSRYDAMNVSYRRRLAKRFSINTNYVLSRALAYVGGPAAFGNAASNPSQIFMPTDLGPAPNDERHRWVFSSVVQLPWGIQLSPIMQWASARPWNATEGIVWRGTGSGNGTTRAVVLTSDPNNLKATAGLSAAAIRTGVANGTMTELPYNAFRGQSFYQFDLRVSKFFTFKERHRLELIAQFFDIGNRANFGGNYVASIRSATFGTPNGFFTPGAVVVPKSFAAEMAFQYRF